MSAVCCFFTGLMFLLNLGVSLLRFIFCTLIPLPFKMLRCCFKGCRRNNSYYDEKDGRDSFRVKGSRYRDDSDINRQKIRAIKMKKPMTKNYAPLVKKLFKWKSASELVR
ncbi:hypothetical protein ACXGSE_13470 [Enterococcus hirae]